MKPKTTKTMQALVYDPKVPRWLACKAVGFFHRPVYWSGISCLALKRVPIPELPTSQWVRLRPIMGGICGTDMSTVLQQGHPASILQAFSSFPAVLGHENVAVIEELGSQVEGWQVGDRVVVEPTLSCVPRGIEPWCDHCRKGHFTRCEHFLDGRLPPGSMIGFNSFTGGSWGEEFVAHMSQLHRVPESLSNEDAVVVDPAASALHALLQKKPESGQHILILGSGIISVAMLACIRALDLDVTVSMIVRSRCQADIAAKWGADNVITTRRQDSQAVRYGRVAKDVSGRILPTRFGHHAFIGGYDIVYDCVGTGSSLTDAMKYARAGGSVVEVGGVQIAVVDVVPLWLDELSVIGSNGRGIESTASGDMHTYELVFDLMQQGKLRLSELVTHRFPIHRYPEAFAALTNRSRSGAMKVVFMHE